MPESSAKPVAIEHQQVISSTVVYRILDQQTVLFDSVMLPPALLQRFIRTWNTSTEAELSQFDPHYTINLLFKDNDTGIESRLRPGTDVGVVIESAHDDLVPGAPRARESSRA